MLLPCATLAPAQLICLAIWDMKSAAGVAAALIGFTGELKEYT